MSPVRGGAAEESIAANTTTGAPSPSRRRLFGWLTGAAVASAPILAATPAQAEAGSDYASAAKVTPDGSERHVQLGPTTRTLNAGEGGTHSVLGLQNNDPRRADEATRMYLVPSSEIQSGVGGAHKIFGDPYFDGHDYRDMGWYFHANQAGDAGVHGSGAFWFNSKVQGAKYDGRNPDIGFSFQDGGTVAARFSYLGDGRPVLIVGSEHPTISAGMSEAIRLEVQGDIGFGGTGRGIRWFQADGRSAGNLLQFNAENLQLAMDAIPRLTVYGEGGGGSVVMGDEVSELSRTAVGGFFYMRSMPGRPTSVPTVRPGTIPLVMDSESGKLWARLGGKWKSVKFT